MTGVRLRGVLAAVEWIQQVLWQAASPEAKDGDARALARAAASEIDSVVAAVDGALASRGARAGDLARPTRDAICWLRFLADGTRLDGHIESLATAIEAAARAPSGRGGMLRTCRVNLYVMRPLYRLSRQQEGWSLTLNEAFVGAPPGVVAAGVRAALGEREALARFRAYASSEAYLRAARALAAGAPAGPLAAVGRHHDLGRSLARVMSLAGADAVGRMPGADGTGDRPSLAWTSRRTRRKLGHYDDRSDTIAVSRTLDDPRVPEVVVDYVVYHELLHRLLGVKVANGRRLAHGAAFRRAERAFPGYAEAQAFLETRWAAIASGADRARTRGDGR